MTSSALEPSLSSLSIGVVTGFIDQQGINSRSLLLQAGIDPRFADGEIVFFPLARSVRILDIAAEATGDPLIGLHAVEHVLPKVKHAHMFAVFSAPDLGAALGMLAQHFNIVMRLDATYLEHDGTGRFEWKTNEPNPQSAALSDFVAARVIRNLSRAAGKCIVPEHIELTRPAPADASEYWRLLGPNIAFGREVNRIVIGRSDLSVPLPGTDLSLFQILTDHCQDLARQSTGQDDLIERLRDYVSTTMEMKGAVFEGAADLLDVTPCGLRRVLKGRSTTFKEVRDGKRQELADYYLRQTNLPLTEIAFILGFSEQSALTRACKRWFGEPPRAYRGQH